jgi:hypothetical protein
MNPTEQFWMSASTGWTEALESCPCTGKTKNSRRRRDSRRGVVIMLPWF